MKKISTEKKINRTLDELFHKIILGYTHENFVEIGYILKDLEFYLEPLELDSLKEFWRNSYTDSCDEVELSNQIEKIKSRLN